MEFETLRPGDSGTYVELMQLALWRSGYLSEPPDGIYGPLTRAAVIRFQRDNALDQDGVVGEHTWRRLYPFLVGYTRHRIRQGDTLYRISRSYYTTVPAIETANPGLDPLRLRVGAVITVPYGFDVVPVNIRFTPTALTIALEGLSVRYPLMEQGSIGKSVMGRDIPYVRFGGGKNQVFYNGSHHANEWITTPLLLTFLEKYMKAYAFSGTIFGQRARVLYELSSLYIVPMVNPDGVSLVTGELRTGNYYRRARLIATGYRDIPFPAGWKANIEGIDPNLQYPAGWEEARKIKFAQGFDQPAPRDYVGAAPLEIPESRAVYNFTREHDFILTLSYHTQGRVIYWRYLNYLPDNSYEIAQRFSAVSGYAVELTPPESGYAGYKDWFIQEYDRPGYTIEAGSGISPLPLSDFNGIYDENEGILTLGLTASIE